MQQARKIVAKEFEAVNQLIIDQLHSNVPLVENIGHYIVDAGGKRLRPMLVLLCAGTRGTVSEDHITLATVIEFIHTATLLHDDVVDISALRRGRPTANAEWGNAPSVLVGDFLYSRAFQLMVKMGNMQIMSLLADATNTIAEGEVLQLIRAGDPDTSEEDYFQVIRNKTAVLFAAATAGAAILSGDSNSDIESAYQYGLHLGMAFQLTDDVLDYCGSVEEMGKNVGDDLAEGKPTLPLIYIMREGQEADKKLVRQAISEKSSAHLEQIQSIIARSDALNYTREVAAKYSRQATACLDHLPDSAQKQSLARLADLSANRSA